METEGSLLHSQGPRPVPILSQFNPVHPCIPLPEDPSQYYPPIYAWSPQWSPSLRFPYLNPEHSSPFPQMRYISIIIIIIMKAEITVVSDI
jgi:hypothetical protein